MGTDTVQFAPIDVDAMSLTWRSSSRCFGLRQGYTSASSLLSRQGTGLARQHSTKAITLQRMQDGIVDAATTAVQVPTTPSSPSTRSFADQMRRMPELDWEGYRHCPHCKNITQVDLAPARVCQKERTRAVLLASGHVGSYEARAADKGRERVAFTCILAWVQGHHQFPFKGGGLACQAS